MEKCDNSNKTKTDISKTAVCQITTMKNKGHHYVIN
jgi:hypothetical protein